MNWSTPARIALLLSPALFGLDVNTVQHLIYHGGPVMIFVLLFACGLGLPLPEDIPLIIGGFFAAKGQMHLASVAVFSWLGIIGGDTILYTLGRRYGREITRVAFIGKHLTEQRLVRAEQLFDRWGVWVVAVGRLFAGIRGAMVATAGVTRFKFTRFIIADGLAALVSGGLFVGIGYFLGRKIESVDKIRETIKPYEHVVIAGIVAVVLILAAYLWWRSQRHNTVTDVALGTAVKVTERKPRAPQVTEPAAK